MQEKREVKLWQVCKFMKTFAHILCNNNAVSFHSSYTELRLSKLFGNRIEDSLQQTHLHVPYHAKTLLAIPSRYGQFFTFWLTSFYLLPNLLKREKGESNCEETVWLASSPPSLVFNSLPRRHFTISALL